MLPLCVREDDTLEVAKMIVSDCNINDLLIPAVQREAFKVTNFLLVMGADVDTVDDNRRNALHYACSTGNLPIFLSVIQYYTEYEQVDIAGWTPLHLACYSGNKSIVEALLAKGVNPMPISYSNTTPRYWASINGFRDIEELLISHGALDADSELEKILS